MISDRWLFSGLPALLTISIHVGIVLVLGFRWAGPTQVIAAAPTAQAVQAVLVSADSWRQNLSQNLSPNQSQNQNQNQNQNHR